MNKLVEELLSGHNILFFILIIYVVNLIFSFPRSSNVAKRDEEFRHRTCNFSRNRRKMANGSDLTLGSQVLSDTVES